MKQDTTKFFQENFSTYFNYYKLHYFELGFQKYFYYFFIPSFHQAITFIIIVKIIFCEEIKKSKKFIFLTFPVQICTGLPLQVLNLLLPYISGTCLCWSCFWPNLSFKILILLSKFSKRLSNFGNKRIQQIVTHWTSNFGAKTFSKIQAHT